MIKLNPLIWRVFFMPDKKRLGSLAMAIFIIKMGVRECRCGPIRDI